MRYDKPQTCYVRAAAVDVAKPSEMDKNPAPRTVPDIDAKLQADIAGCIDIHDFKDGTHLYSLMFEWPTHEDMQDATAKGIAELVKSGKAWMTLDDLPKLDIEVTATVEDTAKSMVDGRYPTKTVQVMEKTATHAAKFCFVGEARAVEVAKPIEEPIEAEGKLSKQQELR
jgi:hypothetical protein